MPLPSLIEDFNLNIKIFRFGLDFTVFLQNLPAFHCGVSPLETQVGNLSEEKINTKDCCRFNCSGGFGSHCWWMLEDVAYPSPVSLFILFLMISPQATCLGIGREDSLFLKVSWQSVKHPFSSQSFSLTIFSDKTSLATAHFGCPLFNATVSDPYLR